MNKNIYGVKVGPIIEIDNGLNLTNMIIILC